MRNLKKLLLGVGVLGSLGIFGNARGQENSKIDTPKFETYIEMNDKNKDTIFDEYIFIQNDFFEERQQKIVLKDTDFNGKIDRYEYNFLGLKGEDKGYNGGFLTIWLEQKEDLLKRNCKNPSFGAHYSMDKLSNYKKQEDKGINNLLLNLRKIY